MIVKMKNNSGQVKEVNIPEEQMSFAEFKKIVGEYGTMIRTQECANFDIVPGGVGSGLIIMFFPHRDYSSEYIEKHGSSPLDVTPISA